MPSMFHTEIILFLPGTWIIYALSRWGMSFTPIPVIDQVAMSFLAALCFVVCAGIIVGVAFWHRYKEWLKARDFVSRMH
jgi:hypothetical protein